MTSHAQSDTVDTVVTTTVTLEDRQEEDTNQPHDIEDSEIRGATTTIELGRTISDGNDTALDKLNQIGAKMNSIILDKEHELEKIIQHKGLHYAILICCIVGPSILIATFLIATKENGKSVEHYSVSAGIAHYKQSVEVFRLTLFATILSTIIAFFVSMCRQIQICVTFEKYLKIYHTEERIFKKYCWLNNIAVFFNISGYLSIILFVIFDSRRYKIHTVFATYAVFATGGFLLFTLIITFKQRNIEYRANLLKTSLTAHPKWEAFKSTFYIDAILMLLLFIGATIFWIVYAVEYFTLDGMPSFYHCSLYIIIFVHVFNMFFFLCFFM